MRVGKFLLRRDRVVKTYRRTETFGTSLLVRIDYAAEYITRDHLPEVRGHFRFRCRYASDH